LIAGSCVSHFSLLFFSLNHKEGKSAAIGSQEHKKRRREMIEETVFILFGFFFKLIGSAESAKDFFIHNPALALISIALFLFFITGVLLFAEAIRNFRKLLKT